MGKYQSGDHIKFEVIDGTSGQAEWLWLLVSESDDERQVVFGKLDSQPVAVTNLHLGQDLAVSYGNVRDHRTFGQ